MNTLRLTTAKSAFDKLVRHELTRLGFWALGNLQYSKKIGDTDGFVLFGIRNDPQGYFAATGNVGLHLPKLDPLIDSDYTGGIHINVPFRFISSRICCEWQFVDRGGLEKLRDDLLDVLNTIVIPFLEANADISDVYRNLSSADSKSWYVLTDEKRVCFLAAIYAVFGRHEDALRLVRTTLFNLNTRSLSKRGDLEALERVLKQQPQLL
jgi:hypothetical protein